VECNEALCARQEMTLPAHPALIPRLPAAGAQHTFGGMGTEIQVKMQKLAEFLDGHALDGVLLTHRNNFAWITCGRDNHIANNSPVGVASILATRDDRVCLASSIEAPRMKNEELAGTGIEVIEFPWWDGAAATKKVAEVIGGRKVAADSASFGLPLAAFPGGFGELRWSLTPEEIDRYREGAKRTSAAMEKSCGQLKHAMSEHEIAGLLDHEVRNAGLNPVVTLVAADDRIRSFRHPIPTELKAREYVMLVSCAERAGLISCLTRFVAFGSVSAELKAKQQAIANIDAAVNLATKPGRTLGDIFADLQKSYANNGHPDQWKFHHQGGSTGYAGREVVATPGSTVKVVDNQAFAWNPSIVGTKSEDTVLCTSSGIEVLTKTSKGWPMIEGRAGDLTLMRADILIV
jgi:Xaa-Pro dipeptidase